MKKVKYIMNGNTLEGYVVKEYRCDLNEMMGIKSDKENILDTVWVCKDKDISKKLLSKKSWSDISTEIDVIGVNNVLEEEEV